MTTEQFEAMEKLKACIVEMREAARKLDDGFSDSVNKPEQDFLRMLRELPKSSREYILGLLYGMWLESKKDD